MLFYFISNLTISKNHAIDWLIKYTKCNLWHKLVITFVTNTRKIRLFSQHDKGCRWIRAYTNERLNNNSDATNLYDIIIIIFCNNLSICVQFYLLCYVPLIMLSRLSSAQLILIFARTNVYVDKYIYEYNYEFIDKKRK